MTQTTTDTRTPPDAAAGLAELVSAGAHALAGPTRVASGFAELLEQRFGDQLEGDAKAYLDRIATAAETIQDLVGDLLRLARIESHPLTLAPVESGTLLRRALLDVARVGPAIELKIGELPVVLADAELLEQAFVCMLENARTFHDGRGARVEASAEHEQGAWRFSLYDDGIGIPDDQAQRIFEPFERLNGDGLGTGLALCRRVVERHGGQIWVTSQPGAGSTFHFTIPDGDSWS
jgi:chemotaxis family two-component system sensor kinase Cph1